jgi:carboxyl-terminal processing protease
MMAMRNLAISIFVLCLTGAVCQTFGQEISGIGVALRKEGADLIVDAVIPDSPAALSKAIHRGDRMIAIAQDDDPPVKIKGLNLEEAVHLIRGPKGTTVRVTILPAGKDESEAHVVSLVRGALKLAHVEAETEANPFTILLLRLAIALAHP